MDDPFEAFHHKKSKSSKKSGYMGMLEEEEGGEDIELGNTDATQSENVDPLQQVIDRAKSNIFEIRSRIDELRKMHSNHLTYQFSSQKDQQEMDIEDVTMEIKQMFQNTKRYIEGIRVPKNISNQREAFLNNVKLALTTELFDVSKLFRLEQTKYIQKLQVIKAKEKSLSIIKIEETTDFSEAERKALDDMQAMRFDPGFTEAQIEELTSNQIQIVQRDKELRDVLKSVVELQDIFKEMNTLIIEQGTMLDRIDYNLVKTNEHLKQSGKNLEKAQKWQKLGGLTICLMLLILFVAIVGGFFIIRIVLKIATRGIL